MAQTLYTHDYYRGAHIERRWARNVCILSRFEKFSWCCIGRSVSHYSQVFTPLCLDERTNNTAAPSWVSFTENTMLLSVLVLYAELHFLSARVRLFVCISAASSVPAVAASSSSVSQLLFVFLVRQKCCRTGATGASNIQNGSKIIFYVKYIND